MSYLNFQDLTQKIHSSDNHTLASALLLDLEAKFSSAHMDLLCIHIWR